MSEPYTHTHVWVWTVWEGTRLFTQGVGRVSGSVCAGPPSRVRKPSPVRVPWCRRPLCRPHPRPNAPIPSFPPLPSST